MLRVSRQGGALRCLIATGLLSAALAARARADEPVVWTNVVNASVSGSVLTKTGSSNGWDAGAASIQVIRDGYGYVEVVATETNKTRMIGLSNGDSTQDTVDIDYGIQ